MVLYRFFILFLVFMIYFFSGFFLLLKSKGSKRIFSNLIVLSVKLLLAAMGTKLSLPNLNKFKDETTLFIANHDSILDGPIVMAYLNLYTIVSGDIGKYLPFSASYAHYLNYLVVDESEQQSKAQCLYDAFHILKQKGQFLLFPSEGVRKLETHFASGAYYLAKKTNARVIPLFIHYSLPSAETRPSRYNHFTFILTAILKGNLKINIECGEKIPMNSFASEDEFKAYVLTLYKINVYESKQALIENATMV